MASAILSKLTLNSMPSIPPQLVLASGSPRRQSLLTEAGYDFRVIVPAEEAECGVCATTGPAELVRELALRKAANVVEQLLSQSSLLPPTLLLAADTVAECQGRILGKPADESHAREMLSLLSGREHRVYTGVCLWPLYPSDHQSPPPLPHVETVVTRLVTDTLSDAVLDEYLASGEWRGKAGAFGYQDRLGWVHVSEGSESNVVGLPMERVAELLAGHQVFTCPKP